MSFRPRHKAGSARSIWLDIQGYWKEELAYILVVFSSSLVISCARNSAALCAASACRFSARARAAAEMAASSPLSKVSTRCSRTYTQQIACIWFWCCLDKKKRKTQTLRQQEKRLHMIQRQYQTARYKPSSNQL